MTPGARQFLLSLFLFIASICTASAQTGTNDLQRDRTQPAGKHLNPKDDVAAIGTRNIGGKGLGNWYSLEKEISIGRTYAQQIDSTAKLLQDEQISEYINRIAQNLVRNSDAKVPFVVKIVDSEEVNACALPGGFFYINTGLILAADSEAELAGVMSHEIAHVAARHATRQMTRSNIFTLASIPLIFVGGGFGIMVQEAASLAIPLTFSRFSRGFEREADYLGVQYMYKAGYDPQAFVSFFEKVTAKAKKKPGTLAAAFATHPPTSQRLLSIEHEIGTVIPVREEYVVTTSDFEEVKSRLTAIENKRKITDEYRRSLRGSAESGNGPAAPANDDRPTLKRRD